MKKEVKLVLFFFSLLFLLSSCTVQEPGKKPIACTLEEKQCPDGSSVSRDANNNCKFFPCPQPKNACPADIKQCPDGSYVNRDPNKKCEFSPCKESKADTEQLLDLKAYLIKKYDPGTCFGMPGPTREEDIDRAFKANPELVLSIKKRFGNTLDNPRIYIKMQQFAQINLEKADAGYKFTYEDGDCCWIAHNEGKIILDKKSITNTITSSTSRNEPC